jgi:anti-anti-sigma factor
MPCATRIIQTPPFVTLRPEGELEQDTVANFRDGAAATLASGEQVILDLSHLRFVDAAGVRALAWAARRARDAGGSLVACTPRPQLAACSA